MTFRIGDWKKGVGAALLSATLGCSAPSGEKESRDAPPASISQDSQIQSAESQNPQVAQVGPIRIYLDEILKLTQVEEMAPMIDLAPEGGPDPIRGIRMETLKRLIDRRLLVLESAKHPELVDDASWEEEVQRLYVQMGADEIDRRRNAAGVAQDEFDNQFRRFVREEMMIRALLAREIADVIPPTESEIRERYEEERETTFTRPDSWAAYRIERYADRANAADLPALLQDLDRIRSEAAVAIASATTLAEAANRMAPFVRKHSEAEDAQVGYAFVYDTPKAGFDPEFVARVREAPLGELSPVFELAGDDEKVGGCFFLLFEHRPGQTVPFETAKPVLAKQMMEERSAAKRAELFARVEAEFPTEIFEEHLYSGLPAEDSGDLR